MDTHEFWTEGVILPLVIALFSWGCWINSRRSLELLLIMMRHLQISMGRDSLKVSTPVSPLPRRWFCLFLGGGNLLQFQKTSEEFGPMKGLNFDDFILWAWQFNNIPVSITAETFTLLCVASEIASEQSRSLWQVMINFNLPLMFVRWLVLPPHLLQQCLLKLFSIDPR